MAARERQTQPGLCKQGLVPMWQNWTFSISEHLTKEISALSHPCRPWYQGHGQELDTVVRMQCAKLLKQVGGLALSGFLVSSQCRTVCSFFSFWTASRYL